MSRKSELRELRAQVAALETKSAGTLAEPDARLWEIFGLGLNVSTAAGEPVGPSSAEQGFGVELRIAPHHVDHNAFPDNLPSLVVYADALPQALTVLSEAHAAIITLKRARRR